MKLRAEIGKRAASALKAVSPSLSESDQPMANKRRKKQSEARFPDSITMRNRAVWKSDRKSKSLDDFESSEEEFEEKPKARAPKKLGVLDLSDEAEDTDDFVLE